MNRFKESRREKTPRLTPPKPKYVDVFFVIVFVVGIVLARVTRLE